MKNIRFFLKHATSVVPGYPVKYHVNTTVMIQSCDIHVNITAELYIYVITGTCKALNLIELYSIMLSEDFYLFAHKWKEKELSLFPALWGKTLTVIQTPSAGIGASLAGHRTPNRRWYGNLNTKFDNRFSHKHTRRGHKRKSRDASVLRPLVFSGAPSLAAPPTGHSAALELEQRRGIGVILS